MNYLFFSFFFFLFSFFSTSVSYLPPYKKKKKNSCFRGPCVLSTCLLMYIVLEIGGFLWLGNA